MILLAKEDLTPYRYATRVPFPRTNSFKPKNCNIFLYTKQGTFRHRELHSEWIAQGDDESPCLFVESVCDGSHTCCGDKLGVLREHASGVAGCGRLPGGAAGFEFGGIHVEREA